MIKEGTRPFYIITRGSNYDGYEYQVLYITKDKKNAIEKFEWFHRWCGRDYLNDEGEAVYNGTDYYLKDNKELNRDDPNYIRGNFWFDDDDGYYVQFNLTTCYTNRFCRWDGTKDTNMENKYLEDLANATIQ